MSPKSPRSIWLRKWDCDVAVPGAEFFGQH